ncbi:MAG: phosphoglycerate dehydrogenase [Erysipelotrichaceae bacterium]|nr:phosphoglycerate dehydrogenase [Erysipelotrichaceae bacterium]
MYRIKTLNNISPSAKEVLKAPDYEMGNAIEKPDALFVRASDLHNYDFNPELKCIGRAGIGVNTIPLTECAEKGIVVFNTPGGNANAVKELFLFGITMASRDLMGGMRWVYSYDGSEGPIEARMEKIKKQFVGPEFYGRTIGVVGTGNVGSLVANIALDLGMKVYAYDPYLSVDAAWKVSRRVFRVASLDDLLKHVDYLTLHTPLTDETRGMINAEKIALMKDGVRVINYARGEVVDEDAMIAALKSGKVARFVADFPTAAMVKAPNTVLTPHLGGTTYEAESNCARMAAEEIDDYLRNGNIKNSVNMPDVFLERSGKNRICLIHRNIPGMLTNIMPVFSKDNINIEHMTNKSKGDFAYSVFDVNSQVDKEAVEELQHLNGMIRVRIL